MSTRDTKKSVRRYQRKFERAKVTKGKKEPSLLPSSSLQSIKIQRDSTRLQTADEMDEIKMFEKIVVVVAEIKENQKTYQQININQRKSRTERKIAESREKKS